MDRTEAHPGRARGDRGPPAEPRTEEPHCPRGLTIEHVLPQSWQAHWSDGIDLSDKAAVLERDATVQKLGNLTLVNDRLNPALSNNAWLTSTGASGNAGTGKADQLLANSLMRMTRDVLDKHPTAWTDEDIDDRSLLMARMVASIWPRPAAIALGA